MVRETIAELARLRWSPRAPRRSAYYAGALLRVAALSVQAEGVRRFMLPSSGFVPSESEVLAARRRALALIEEDWRNVERAVYPAALASGFPWAEFVRSWPALLLDVPGWRARAREGRHELDVEASAHLPAYYRRAFHWQTGGYLGRGSARRYDAQVEVLFGGLADAMRRQVLPPVVRFARGREAQAMSLIDLGCGTGGLLRMLAATIPGLRLWGLDLSAHYVAHARRRLADLAGVSIVEENAEHTPFADHAFDIVTSVFVAHELPTDARHRVFAEAFRILAPGGIFVLADSVQPADAPDLARFLDAFPRQFHEPYYRSYLRDDLQRSLGQAGFVLEEQSTHLLTKVVVARRPGS